MPRPPAYLFVGPEELLLRRAADRLLAELGEERGELDVSDLRASELPDGQLPDLRTGSLFGTPRVVVVREAEALPAEAGRALARDLQGSAPDATVVLLASGTGRLQQLAKVIKDAGGRIDVAPPREWATKEWQSLVAAEFRHHGRTADTGAVEAILAAAGFDVSAIAEKVAQAAAGAPAEPGGKIQARHVERVVVGHGSRGSFAVADAMCDRDPARALSLLRGVLESGDDPIMVLGALAYRLRSLVAVAGGLDGKAVGASISAGQARRLQGVRRRFGPGELTAAYRTLADADAAMKGSQETSTSELPPALVLEQAVVRIATPAA